MPITLSATSTYTWCHVHCRSGYSSGAVRVTGFAGGMGWLLCGLSLGGH